MIVVAAAAALAASPAKIVLIAGKPSHGPGQHEFNAGTLLLEKCNVTLPPCYPEIFLETRPRFALSSPDSQSLSFFPRPAECQYNTIVRLTLWGSRNMLIWTGSSTR